MSRDTVNMNLTKLATAYSDAVTVLDQTKGKLKADNVLACLVARDNIAFAFENDVVREVQVVKLTTAADTTLQKLAASINKVSELGQWRKTLNPPKEAWWWHLSSPPGYLEKLDWFWSALAVLAIALALALTADMANRFLQGGPDWTGAWMIIVQIMLTFFAAGGALSKVGQEAVDRTLDKFSVADKAKPAWHFGLSLVPLVLALILWGLLPSFSRFYNNQGYASWQEGQLDEALRDLQKAIRLDGDNRVAHYNLGLVYEDLLDTEKAITEYQIAATAGLDLAQNNLARLFIKEEKYAEAVSLLLKISKANQEPEVQYDILKNLGWARLKQERFSDAVVPLQEAITLYPNKADAHCLLAQVWQGQSELVKAKTSWETCLGLAKSTNPDEDNWSYQGVQFLQSLPETED